MKKLIIIMGLLLIAAPVMGATTPSPTPSPSPTPVPNVIPDGVSGDIATVLRGTFTDFTSGAITDHKLINLRTGEAFTVPAGHRFYITGVNWSLQSVVIGSLEWDGASADVLFDRMYAPFTGQGKVLNYITPITSLDAGISPVLTTDRGCTGIVVINGFLR